MGLADHARRELEMIGAFSAEGDFYGGMTGKAVMELIEKFAEQGHSGMSASIVRSMFHKLANYEPLGPLTGEDREWQEIGEGTYQNVRCSRVFKDAKMAYDIEGYVFEEPNGSRYTNFGSRRQVVFPYTPVTEYLPSSQDPSRTEGG